jgi:hypothetical protein
MDRTSLNKAARRPASSPSSAPSSAPRPTSLDFDFPQRRPFPAEMSAQIRREMRQTGAMSHAVTRRAQIKEIRHLAHRFLQGELSPVQVRARLTQRGHFILDRATVYQEFFDSLARLRTLWIKPRDRYAIKLAVAKRLAQPGSMNLGPDLQHMRLKYGDEAVNHAIGEEMVLRASGKDRDAAKANYSTQRQGVQDDIATLSFLLIDLAGHTGVRPPSIADMMFDSLAFGICFRGLTPGTPGT